MKACLMLYKFSCSTTGLQGGFCFGKMWSYRDLPFSFTSKAVFVTNANASSSENAFCMAYETADNRTASRVGQVNVIRWDSAAINSTAAVFVVGY